MDSEASRSRQASLLRQSLQATPSQSSKVTSPIFDNETHIDDLHIVESGDDDLSPASKKFIQMNSVSILPATAENHGVVIQRPKSSGIDMTGFSFRKASQSRTRLSFRPTPGQPLERSRSKTKPHCEDSGRGDDATRFTFQDVEWVFSFSSFCALFWHFNLVLYHKHPEGEREQLLQSDHRKIQRKFARWRVTYREVRTTRGHPPVSFHSQNKFSPLSKWSRTWNYRWWDSSCEHMQIFICLFYKDSGCFRDYWISDF